MILFENLKIVITCKIERHSKFPEVTFHASCCNFPRIMLSDRIFGPERLQIKT